MANLEFREATPHDLDFVWQAYSENIQSLSIHRVDQKWVDDQEKTGFAERWSAQNTRIIVVDGERIGWFSCVTSGTELLIDSLQLLKGNRGMRSFVLNIIVMEATDQNRNAPLCSFNKDPALDYKTVSLRLFKNDPALEFFRSEGFSILEEPDLQVRVDVSGILRHSHLGWKKKEASNA